MTVTIAGAPVNGTSDFVGVFAPATLDDSLCASDPQPSKVKSPFFCKAPLKVMELSLSCSVPHLSFCSLQDPKPSTTNWDLIPVLPDASICTPPNTVSSVYSTCYPIAPKTRALC